MIGFCFYYLVCFVIGVVNGVFSSLGVGISHWDAIKSSLCECTHCHAARKFDSVLCGRALVEVLRAGFSGPVLLFCCSVSSRTFLTTGQGVE